MRASAANPLCGCGSDGGQERLRELLQLGCADAVDLGELRLGERPPAHHVDQRAVGEHDIGRYAALPCDLQAKRLEGAQQRRVLAGQGRFANGWKLARRRLMGADRIEIEGPTDSDTDALKRMGCVAEIVSWRTRLFAPDRATLERITDRWPIAAPDAA